MNLNLENTTQLLAKLKVDPKKQLKRTKKDNRLQQNLAGKFDSEHQLPSSAAPPSMVADLQKRLKLRDTPMAIDENFDIG